MTTAEELARLKNIRAESERGVLSAAIVNPERYYALVTSTLREEDFADRAHAAVFRAICEIGPDDIGAETLVAKLQEYGVYDEIGAYGLARIIQESPTGKSVRHCLKLVQGFSFATKLALVCAQTRQEASRFQGLGVESLIAKAANRIAELQQELAQQSADSTHLTARSIVLDAIDEIDARQTGTLSGVPTGYVDVDRILMGLRPGELIVVAARPGLGKSSLAINIAQNTASAGHTTLLVSVEMSPPQIGARLLARISRTPLSTLRCPPSRHSDRGANLISDLLRKAEELADLPLYLLCQASCTFGQIATHAQHLRSSKQLQLLIVDYLQLLQPTTPSKNREQQVAEISRQFKILAQKLGIPILLLAQLNRRIELDAPKTKNAAQNFRPKLAYLRESGAIEQDADVVAFIHHPQDQLEAEIIVAKNRNGPTGTAKVAWVADFASFENLAHHV